MAAKQQDVIIVGAGPTGLALAAELRRLGVNAMLFEKESYAGTTSRATVVHARTLEVLEPLGISKRLIDNGLILHTAHLREGSEIKATISFDDLPTAYSYILVCTQDRTESVLTQRLQELGGHVTRCIDVTSLAHTPDSVTLTYTAAGVLVQDITAGWVVGCDGLHSIVRQAAGIAFEGGDYEESFILADVEMDWPLGRDAMELFLHEAGLTLVVALPGGLYRIIATVADAPKHPTISDCQKILNERTVPGAVVHNVHWSSRFRIQHRVARKLRQGRILIAGDAAHVHSPAGGQGMNTGIQDATTLAAALHQAIATGDESGIAKWEAERLKIARNVVSTTDTMTKLAATSSPVMHAVRDAVLGLVGHVPVLGHAVARRLSEIDNK
ncbi:FAD-dependent oxidoreductase [Terriglobus roseus]|uniref:2-polyprenyl-6-methoxyphenol hydroxylase n=1 Tax=Terriglobus roseus TaxID=392734 RepID=A0A1H4LR08_9BACT|nr:FAD-dependent oxidoreductase [Terriglobus roseus]SEB73170.1 2-polyprenyl-6-methoxyphenol hydroxylase [Terriglobus roseus]